MGDAMDAHTFDPASADRLERAERRYRYLSAEEVCWALAPEPGDVVLDLGSGTGFYTDDVAPHVAAVYAVDLQPAMHGYYREKGVPENVAQVTAAARGLPLRADSVDAVLSTMTFHEFAGEAALSELGRVLGEGGRLVVADWAASGSGDVGAPLAERYDCEEATDALRAASFVIEHAATRPETFLIVATAECAQ